MKNKLSLGVYITSILFIFYLSFFYYPKWDKTGTEATIVWDVSGYYMYLPGIFIYKDIKECKFKDDVMKKYHPTPDFQQGLRVKNGNYVMKYPIGQAIQFLPFFSLAHWYALNSDEYDADGFSKPYQFMISIEILFFAMLGLWFLRLILLKYFKDNIVAIVLLGIAIGTNYLEYASMTGGMTHNNLFAIYAILIYTTIKFYKNPGFLYAAIIGLLVGFATITRVTDIISLLIPLFWGISFSKESMKRRIDFLKSNMRYLILAGILTILVGSIQLFYWKYASGDWLVYSYDDQGFKFLKPHLWLGIFSYRNGWLVYTPMMIFPLIGYYYLWKNKKELFAISFSFFVLAIYIVFAWNIWWYGGSLGARALIQYYPILAFPFAGIVQEVLKKKYIKYFFYFAFVLFVYYNIWLTHQAHYGGMFKASKMTKAYFWKTLGRYDRNENDLKLLDTKEEFTGERKNVKTIYENNFDKDTLIYTCDSAIDGTQSLCLDGNHQFSIVFIIEKPTIKGEWVRASADFNAPSKEWTDWKMTQFIIGFYSGNEVVKERMIRVHRFLKDNQTRNIFFDTKIPDKKYDNIKVKFWNSSGQKKILIDNLKLEIYEQ